MIRRSASPFRQLTLALLAAWAGAAFEQTTIQSLTVGQRIEGSLSPSISSRSYVVNLGVGQYLNASVEQEVDISILLYGPDGTQIRTVDAFERGRESASLVATTTGSYRLEIRSESPPKAGGYHLLLKAVRIPSVEDNKRLSAEDLSTQAKRLQGRSTADSLQRALSVRKESAAIWHELQEPFAELETITEIGNLQYALGEPSGALGSYREAMNLSRLVGDRRSEAELLHNIGICAMNLGQTDDALGALTNSLRIISQLRAPELEVAALANLGMIYYRLGEPRTAIQYYERAVRVTREIGYRHQEGLLLNNVGLAYSSEGDNRQAIAYLERASEIFRQSGDSASTARTFNALSRAYLGADEIAKAGVAQQNALKLSATSGNRRLVAEGVEGLARIHERGGDLSSAMREYERALELYRSIQDRLGERRTLQGLASVHIARGDNETAIDVLQRAVVISKDLGLRAEEAEALYSMAQVGRRRSDLAGARKRIESAIALSRSVQGGGSRNSTGFKREYYNLYIDLLMASHERSPTDGFDRRAFDVAEQVYSLSISQRIRELNLDVREGVDVDLLDRERDLRRRLNYKSTQLATGTAAKQVSVIRDEIDTLLGEYADVERQIRRSSPHYAALSQPNFSNIQEVQALLDDETILVEYYLGNEYGYAWVITRNECTSLKLARRTLIESAARALVQAQRVRTGQLTGKQNSELRQRTAALSRLLVTPIETLLSKKRVVIIADGILGYVPFASLQVSDSGASSEVGNLLIAAHEIVVLPAASLARSIRREWTPAKPASGDVAALADPVYDELDPRVAPPPMREASSNSGVQKGLPRLLFSRREAQSILMLTSEQRNLRAFDFEASKSTLMSGDLARYRIVHISAHGAFNHANPDRSGIVLSLVDARGTPIDGVVRIRDIYNLKLSAELVTLDTDISGLSDNVDRSGLSDMTVGFFYSGAARVLISLWPVEDAASAEFMRQFYTAIFVQRLRPAAALRSAQMEMMRSSRWRDAYYWAGFVLQGDWR